MKKIYINKFFRMEFFTSRCEVSLRRAKIILNGKLNEKLFEITFYEDKTDLLSRSPCMQTNAKSFVIKGSRKKKFFF